MLLTLLAACAPELEEIERDEIPDLEMVSTLSFSRVAPSQLPFSLKTISKPDEETIDQTLERLIYEFQLARELRNKEYANSILSEFWATMNNQDHFTITPFYESSYVKAILGYSYKDIRVEIDSANTDLVETQKRIPELLARLSRNYKWPSVKSFRLERFEPIMVDYFNLVPKQLRAFDIYEPIVKEVEEKLFEGDHWDLIKKVQESLIRLKDAPNFAVSLGEVNRLIDILDFKASKETTEQLQKGFLIAQSVDRTVDPVSALSLLVDAWILTDPNDREALFAAQSRDLYDFLNSESTKNLQCYLPRYNCAGPIKFFIRELAILPEIEGYGVRNIRSHIDRAGQEQVIEAVKIEVLNYLRDIDEVISNEINLGLFEAMDELQEIKEYPNEYLRSRVQDWQEANRGSLSEIRLKTSSVFDFSPTKSKTDQIHQAKAKRLGLLLRLLNEASYVENDEDSLDSIYLSILRMVLDLSGIKEFDDSYQSSMYFNFKTGGRVEYLLETEKIDFPLVVYKSNSPNEFWNDHGDLMIGLAQSLSHFEDWKTSRFDHRLSKIKASDFINDVESDALNQAVFPKDVVYAMTLANLMLLAKNLTFSDFGLHVANSRYEFLPYNKDVEKPSTRTAMAAVMSKNESGYLTVDTDSMTTMIKVLYSIVSKTEGISNSKSELLLETMGSEGMDGFKSILRDLELLLAASSNFVSHYLNSPQNRVYSGLMLIPPSKFEYQAESKRSSLEALGSYQMAYSRFPISVYKWVYLDSYESLHQRLKQSEKTTSLDKIKLNLIFSRWLNQTN